METKNSNPVVESQVKNTTNNTKDMNKIDFSKVYGERAVTKTTAVDQQEVNRLFKAFISIPSSVEVKFQNIKGYLFPYLVS